MEIFSSLVETSTNLDPSQIRLKLHLLVFLVRRVFALSDWLFPMFLVIGGL